MSINKGIILTGINNLKNSVTVEGYDLPSSDPQGGIHLTAQTPIKNPLQVDVQLSRFGTTTWRNGTDLGPVAADHPLIMHPYSVTHLSLSGRL